MSTIDEMLGIDLTDPEDRLAAHLVDADENMLDKIIAVRKLRGMSLDDVGDLMGIDAGSVALIEAGAVGRDPRLSTLRRYAFAVGARVEHIVTADADVTR